jgi:Fe-S cluster assembly ATP-binding protein
MKVQSSKFKVQKYNKNILLIRNLIVSVGAKEILHGVNLEVKSGELHVIMGPNGSGKSTLAHSLMGNIQYQISNIQYQINDKSLVEFSPDEIAKAGVMMTFQNPVAVPGVGLASFIRTAYKELHPETNLSVLELQKMIEAKAKKLELNPEFLKRGINDGLSGGEKKKAEILQLLILKPKFAFFDEIDTGLDIDALQTIVSSIQELLQDNCGVVLITHNPRMLKYLKPDKVHVVINGVIVKEGNLDLIKQIEEKGYGQFQKKGKLSL